LSFLEPMSYVHD